MVAAQTASTLQQFTSDAILVVLVIVNAVLGWRTGTLRRVLSFAGLYGGVLGAYYTGNSFAAVFRRGDIFANAWSFIVITAVVVVIVEIIGRVFADRIQRLAAVTFDRVAGTLIGGVVGFFQASVLFMVALAVGAAPASGNGVPVTRDVAANAVRSAPLSSQVIRAQPMVRTIFNPIFANDLTVHLRDSTQLITVTP
jgi:uncharacterized membrane protein required for colicin V production